jgi:hypothetical protein
MSQDGAETRLLDVAWLGQVLFTPKWGDFKSLR